MTEIDESYVPQKVRAATDAVMAWWESEPSSTRLLFLLCLKDLPGADRVDDLGDDWGVMARDPALGWTEIELLANLLTAIESASDVAYVMKQLIGDEVNEEDAELTQTPGA